MEGEDVFGKALGSSLKQFIAEHARYCMAFDVMLGLFGGSIDEALWKFLHKTADAAAWKKR